MVVAKDNNDTLHLPNRMIGIGVGWGSNQVDADLSLSNGLSIRMPMILSENLKLEPEFGLGVFSQSVPESLSGDIFLLRLGLGAYYIMFFDRLAASFGLSLGLTYWELSVDPSSQSRFDVNFGPVVQLEYFFSKNFSLGADVGLEYISVGKWGGEGSPDSFFSTRAGMFARFYFDLTKGKKKKTITKKTKEAPRPVKKEKPKVTKFKPTIKPETKKEPKVETKIELPGALALECPVGSSAAGQVPPEGYEHYCIREGDRIKHGSYHSYFDNGQLASQGEYKDGQRDGVWLFFYSNQQKRLEAHYQEGKATGTWVFWTKDGQKAKEVQY
jgi:hypothetical protein